MVDAYSPSSSAVQKVYLNPTSGRVNLAQQDQHVVVYDMLGKVMEKVEGVDHIDLRTCQKGCM